jgi:carboxypeptidase family protein
MTTPPYPQPRPAGRNRRSTVSSDVRRIAAAAACVSAAVLALAAQTPVAPGRCAISGRVVDTFGEPVINALVIVETRADGNATRTVAGANTDDRGEYRIGRLAAGSYLVSVLQTQTLVTTPAGRRPPDKLYYPGNTTAAAEAEPIPLDAADERDDIDFVTPVAPSPLSPIIALRMQQLATAGAPPRVAGSAIVRGRVTTPAGAAVAHAHVLLTSSTDVMQTQTGMSGADGRFEFRGLTAGTFHVSASKNDYAPPTVEDGVLPADSRDVRIAGDETRDDVDLHLARLGAISGQVVDEAGEPVYGATVHLLRLRYESGRRRLAPANSAPRLTNDLGRYRLYGITPGQYVVTASVSGGRSADVPGYAPSYYPGTANPAGAQFVSLAFAQNLDGVDIAMARTRTARVAGKVIGGDGQPKNPGSLTLLSSVRAASPVSVSIGARLNSDGTFEFPNVAPGQYVIRADRGRSQPWIEGEFGTLPVVVEGADVTDLVVQTSAGSSITGRLTFDARDASKLPSPSAFELRPLAVDGDVAPQSVATANIHEDFTFEMSGVNGPRRLQVTRAPQGWAQEEIVVRGIDVSDRPLPFGRRDQSLSGVEVRITDRVSALKGALVDGDGHATAGATAIVFATDRSRWYQLSRFVGKAVSDADGAFTVAGLPFGSYYVTALTRLPVGGDEWQDPAFLDTLIPRATTVTVSEGDTRAVRLTMRD